MITHGESLDFATKLARFLQDYGISAFASLCIIAICILYRALRKSEREKFEVAFSIAPLADRLTNLVQRIAKSRSRKSNGESTNAED